MLRKLIGERIRLIRKQKGITQEELAEKAQLMYQYISGVERGSRNISIDSLERIIDALEIETSQIFVFGPVSEYKINEGETDENYILTVHQAMLKERSINEIKAIHRITEEILKSFQIK